VLDPSGYEGFGGQLHFAVTDPVPRCSPKNGIPILQEADEGATAVGLNRLVFLPGKEIFILSGGLTIKIYYRGNY
jgi:hypothetical protein